MVKINFEVSDQLSGNQAPLEDIEDTLSVQNFLADLSQHGFGPFDLVNDFMIVVDGEPHYPLNLNLRHPFSMATAGLNGSLSAMGVKDGSLMTIQAEVIGCGGYPPSKITFLSTEHINTPSPNWNSELVWHHGVPLGRDLNKLAPVLNVLPDNVNYKSVYVTLYGYNSNGQLKTFVSNKTLDEVKHMTSAMFEEREIHEPLVSRGWICFLSSKPFAISFWK